MKFSTTIFLLYASVAFAELTTVVVRADNDTLIDREATDIFLDLEKRKSCSEHRLQTDKCQGKLLRRQNSFHNW
jgi:hypothetical protein